MALLRSLAASLVLLAPAFAQYPGGPCWESNFGTPLNAGNETESPPLPLGFAFPLPGNAGMTTNAIIVGSNGYVWLDAADSLNLGTDWSENVYELLTEGPRIAAAWANLTAVDPARDIYFNTFTRI